MKIIVQAGGKGTRLEKYTLNKPKALVSVDNKPMIFHLFDQFPEEEFYIIVDYKKEVLKKYLRKYAKVKYKIIEPASSGTASGIREIINNFKYDEPFMLVWSDLILNEELKIPQMIANNYIGISEGFKCRWSYINNKPQHTPSTEKGIAGFFIFKNKLEIEDVPLEGAFVKYLSEKEIEFTEIGLFGTKEFGIISEYEEYEKKKPKFRPFNYIEFYESYIEKKPITDYGVSIFKNEVNWYQNLSNSFKNIPKIESFSPLKMERIKGIQLFEANLLDKQKKEILKNIIKALTDLHYSKQPIKAKLEDLNNTYIEKTFSRLEEVINLIPFSNEREIIINGVKCKNILFFKKELIEKLKETYPKKFNFIHGDITFSNLIIKEITPYFIDPRGYFGSTMLFGDADYDWAKLYYSLKGNYDNFNRKKFILEILEDEVLLEIESSGWEVMEEFFFQNIGYDKIEKIKLLHGIIWLSLTTYASDDYDSICAAFYNGLYFLREVM